MYYYYYYYYYRSGSVYGDDSRRLFDRSDDLFQPKSNSSIFKGFLSNRGDKNSSSDVSVRLLMAGVGVLILIMIPSLLPP